MQRNNERNKIVDLYYLQSQCVENLKQRLTEARNEFTHYEPTDHGLVVENSKQKVKPEKSLKRKSMENLPMPKIRKSKFTGEVWPSQ